MKREKSFRTTLATAVAILILLGSAPVYGRAEKEKVQDKSPQAVIERLLVWVQSRMTPPWPEPEPEPDPATSTTGTTEPTTTDVPATST
jgi:hypothetical protein